MAGHDDRDRVLAVGGADSTRPVGVPDGGGDLAIAGRLAVRDLGERLPDSVLERVSPRMQRQVELLPRAGEVLTELRAYVVERRVIALPVVPDSPGIPRLRQVQAGDTALVARDQQRTDRRVDICALHKSRQSRLVA